MWYKEVLPGAKLKSFIKYYFIYESTAQEFEDTVVPSGNIEIIFNLGAGQWKIAGQTGFVTNPPIELWGQITRPLPIKSIGKNIMLGVRFKPHGAAWLLRHNASTFNNQVIDLESLWGSSIRELYDRLLNVQSWSSRISMVENFLLAKCAAAETQFTKVEMVHAMMMELSKDDFDENLVVVASRYGISSRYMQKLFVELTGLSPKLYSKINRFQKSLRLVTKEEISLTSVAYDCGYFDQSHFIREFKAFTGSTPSNYSANNSLITIALGN